MIEFEVKSKKQHISVNIDYKAKYSQQLQSIKDNYKAFDLPYNGKDYAISTSEAKSK